MVDYRRIVREVKRAADRSSLSGAVPCDLLDFIFDGGTVKEWEEENAPTPSASGDET